VIVIFTKFDAQDDKAYSNLETEGIPWADAIKQAPGRAVADFENVYLGLIYGKQYPPKAHIYLRGIAY